MFCIQFEKNYEISAFVNYLQSSDGGWIMKLWTQKGKMFIF